jgi:CheY-like chemotaxis protein
MKQESRRFQRRECQYGHEFADLQVVAIMSFGEKLREQARAAGATDAIDKPTDIARMREVIEAAVSRSSSA